MFSSDFERYFKPVKQFYSGVFPFDKIPKLLLENHFIICNTADSNSTGEHWFVLYRCSSGIIELFDSLGIQEDKKTKLKDLYFRHVKKLKFNVTPVQSNESNLCGEYCIYFVYERLFNKDMKFYQLLNEIFTVDTTVNEKKVNAFLDETLPMLYENV